LNLLSHFYQNLPQNSFLFSGFKDLAHFLHLS
jgi:hypothetical protein